jgi:periplasmic glucans biosynthesis protein
MIPMIGSGNEPGLFPSRASTAGGGAPACPESFGLSVSNLAIHMDNLALSTMKRSSDVKRISSGLFFVLTMAMGGDALSQPAAAPADEGVPGAFTFASVVRRAAELAQDPYERDAPELPEAFASLDYDGFRDIRFRPDHSLWRQDALPFQLQFFHRGFMFQDRVTINVIDGGAVSPVEFSTQLFDYGKNSVPEQIPHDLGFAGLRLLYPINHDDLFDEVAVFLGASYFRAVAQNLNYGITTRGLAIDTGLSTREEFPLFREFWIEKPAEDAVEITVYALMDSPSVAGAFRFVIKPGLETTMEVKNHLYFRDSVQKVGIAPLTSMFMHGELTERFMDDFRPEVHDSDGLIIETGTGERIWRPLINPLGLRISTFQVESPRLFGLLQRDRDFAHYQDLEAHYHNRPSALVEPIGDWGKGVVELVEIPSTSERYDNIVAFWTPERGVEAGDEMEFAYLLRYSADPEERLTGGRTLSTRIGGAGTDELDSDRRKFVVDFVGENLSKLPPDTPVMAKVTTSSGELSPPIAQHNPETGGWRLFFELTPEPGRSAELRGFLSEGSDVLSETWSFEWIPQ